MNIIITIDLYSKARKVSFENEKEMGETCIK
jgi:hypothetical protein